MDLNNFLNAEDDGLFYTGHASFIVRLSGKNYIFDYVGNNKPYGDLWFFFPELTKNIPWSKIDGVFISHVHQDHYDPVLLKTVDCPIYIIGGRPPFEQVLSKNSIKFNVIPPNQKFELESNIFVYGVLHHNNGIDASCYIGNNNFSVYHGNDNYTNNSTLSNIEKTFGGVHVACVPYAYINWYPQLLENLTEAERLQESERLVNHYYHYAIKQASVLKAKRVIPFGANLTYKDSARSPLNMECKTPLDFQDYVASTYGVNEGRRFKALFAGDMIVMHKGAMKEYSADFYNKDTYRDCMQLYLDSQEKPPSLGEIDIVDKTIKIENFSIKFTKKTSYDHLVVVKSKFDDKSVAINTKDGSVEIGKLENLINLNINYTLINMMEVELFNRWVNLEIRLEEVIGSRKFTIFRSPNIYDENIQYIINTQI